MCAPFALPLYNLCFLSILIEGDADNICVLGCHSRHNYGVPALWSDAIGCSCGKQFFSEGFIAPRLLGCAFVVGVVWYSSVLQCYSHVNYTLDADVVDVERAWQTRERGEGTHWRACGTERYSTILHTVYQPC